MFAFSGTTLPRAVAAVGRDHGDAAAVVDAVAERVGREAAEHHRVRRADAGAGQHRHRQLRDHPEVDRHPVAGLDAEPLQRVRHPADPRVQVGVGDLLAVARLALPVVGDLVAALGQVPVQAVGARVQLAVGEPCEERRLRAVHHLGEGGDPVEPARLAGPEALHVGRAPLVVLRRGHRVGGELRRRWEDPVLDLEGPDGRAVAHRASPWSPGLGRIVRRVAPGGTRTPRIASRVRRIPRSGEAEIARIGRHTLRSPETPKRNTRMSLAAFQPTHRARRRPPPSRAGAAVRSRGPRGRARS